MVIALLAAVCMYFQDLMAVFLVQAEARNRAVLAGLMDSLMWIFGISTTAISIDALLNGTFTQKAEVIAAVTIANFFGSYSGVKIGHRYIKEEK